MAAVQFSVNEPPPPLPPSTPPPLPPPILLNEMGENKEAKVSFITVAKEAETFSTIAAIVSVYSSEYLLRTYSYYVSSAMRWNNEVIECVLRELL